MIEAIKDKIAHFIVEQKVKEQEFTYTDFTDFFKKSFTYLVLMPGEDSDFTYAINILKALENSKKHATVFTYDYKMNLVPARYRPHVIDYTVRDISKFNLPGKKLLSKISGKHYNVVIDLNRKENLFCSYISSIVNSPIKIGFSKPEADKYYNFQILNREENPEISYKNFLNCLQMF
jgi:hypothetical protein